MAVLHLSITLDCVDLERIGQFWSAALGFDDVEVDGDYMLVRGSGALSGVRGITLQRVPETKTVKNRMHLDVTVSQEELDAKVDEVVASGATFVEFGSHPGHRWAVMQDPEGNEFCLH